MAIASKKIRTISAERMSDVMKTPPQDGFKLTDDILNDVYEVIDVRDTDFGEAKSFVVTMKNKEGKVINLSASALRKSRVLKESVAPEKVFEDTENIATRSEADELWNSSVYLHTLGMKADEEYVIPKSMKLRYAVLAEDPNTEKPALNPFLYKGFRVVVNKYRKDSNSFPTMEDFKEELLKPEATRIKGLSMELKTPEKYGWVKEDVGNYRHTLIIEDYEVE